MRLWAAILGLVAIAAAAAFGWHWLADDPGYVLVRLRGTNIETTLVFALVALLFVWAVLSVAWRLVRWPLRLWFRRARRRSRERIANGLVALAEGRYGRAEKELVKATQYRELRAPALLAAARAALGRGQTDRAEAMLAEAAETAPAAALALRARLLREQGRLAESLALLRSEATTGTLAPAAWVEFIEAALANGEAEAAYAALEPLARSQSLAPARYDALEARVLAAMLAGQRSADALNARWAALTRARRREPIALAAYARRIAELGQPLPGMSEIESALRKEWSDIAIAAYADLGEADAGTRLRTAESWLATHPDDPTLLTALGRLCVRLGLWGKAHDYLERALGIREDAAAWEALGDCSDGEGDDAAAAHCYRNALRLARSKPSEPLPQHGPRRLDTRAIVHEERSEHGVPRLPDATRR